MAAGGIRTIHKRDARYSGVAFRLSESKMRGSAPLGQFRMISGPIIVLGNQIEIAGI